MQMSAAAIQSQSQSITVWEDNVYLHNEAEMYKEMQKKKRKEKKQTINKN